VEPSVTLTCRGLSGGLSSGRVVGLNDAVLSERCGASSLGVDVLLAGTIDSDLDCDLTAVDLLAVHLTYGLLLQLLRSKRDKAEAATFARLVTSLKLLHHIAGDGTESDLGGGGAIGSEELLELDVCVSKVLEKGRCKIISHLFLAKVVWEVGDHDLVLRGNAILGRSTLTGLTRSTRLLITVGCSFIGCYVRRIGQRLRLAWGIGVFAGFGLTLSEVPVSLNSPGGWTRISSAYVAATTGCTATTTTATSTPPGGVATTASLTLSTALSTAGSSGLLLGSGLRLAS